jgi:subtilisin family serine protease
MKRILLALLFVCGAVDTVASAGQRYLVMTHGPLRRESRGIARRSLTNVDAFAADLTADDVVALRHDPGIRFVEPVVERHIETTTPHPRATTSAAIYTDHQTIPWGIDAIHAREVWQLTRGEGINVAVIDTGIDFTHPELQRAYAGGYNTFSPADPPRDDNFHGTHVAGTIAAADNGFGVLGAAPDVRIWAVKVLDQDGHGDSEHVAAGVDWVLSKKKEIGGRWIMNLSLGALEKSDVEEAIFARAIDEGVVVVAAAGNSAWPRVDYPAGYDGVMAVGALDETGTAAVWENKGAISVAAPGVDVLSTIRQNFVHVSDVTLSDGTVMDVYPLSGSPAGEAHGGYVVCGFGHPGDFPATVQGKIAVILRGEITFNEKARNAKAAGATAVIIAQRPEDPDNVNRWSLVDVCDANNVCGPDPVQVAFDWPLTLGVTSQEAQQILGGAGTMTMIASTRTQDYLILSGTSMATPHVVATAALAWSLAPQLTNIAIRQAIEAAAHDGGDAGYDTTYGNGSIDALATAKLVAPEKFGTVEKRRAARH